MIHERTFHLERINTIIILRYLLQGIAEIGTGAGYACGPVIGGFLYKVLDEIVAISGVLRHERMYELHRGMQFHARIMKVVLLCPIIEVPQFW